MSDRLRTLKFNKNYFLLACMAVLVILSIVLLVSGSISSDQAQTPTMPKISFVGEYKISDGPWQPIDMNKHIPATKGDVTLKGYLRMDELQTDDPQKRLPEGTNVSFYLNHISATVYEQGVEYPYFFDAESEYFGKDSCGQHWLCYSPNDSTKNDLTIVLHNNHNFGNDTAVDDLLDSMYVYASPFFENMVSSFGSFERIFGLVTIIVSFIILGIALFSALLRSSFIYQLAHVGLMTLFGGIYFMFSPKSVPLWNNSIIVNTTVKGISAMFYILLVFCASVYFVSGKAKNISTVISYLASLFGCICVASSFFKNVYFYDAFVYFALITGLLCFVLLASFLFDLKKTNIFEKLIRLLISLILLSYIIDIFGTALGYWQGGEVSKYAFIVVFVTEIVMVLQIIPRNINAAVKAEQLEIEKRELNAELTESRIATMMSQIRPHFIYNTLGSIEQLCEINPSKAGELVHNFAKYLRGNFGELDNPKPIRMSQEIEHVRHYVSIENVRFPDMTFSFEMKSGDFKLPALTIQPIVENAIKHGLMKLSKGGIIRVTSYEDDSDYFVLIEDNGVGFDTDILLDDRKHVGLRNIRERLKAMVGGSLEIESKIGEGTRVLIKIPKEAQK